MTIYIDYLHNYKARNSTKLHVSYKRTNYRKNTAFNKGISMWNCLDEETKNIKSHFSFKKTFKKIPLLDV